MTEQEARAIMALAYESFSALVSTHQVTDAFDQGVFLFNHILQRSVVIWDVDDWPIMRDCWLVAIDKQPEEIEQPKPKNPRNLWAFWH